REKVPQIVVAVLAGPGLIGRVVHEGRHVGEVAEQQHRRGAFHRLERAEERVAGKKDPLAHDDAGLAREPAVHLGHDRAHLLVAHEDRLDLARVVERVEDTAGVAARHAEHELDAGLLEDAHEGVGNVDLVWGHAGSPVMSLASLYRSPRPAEPQPRDGLRLALPYFQSCFDASRAPSAIALNLAQVISGSTWLTDRAKVAKPQSVPAITRSRPTISA